METESTPTIAIVFYSKTGTTAALAGEIAVGVVEADCQPRLLSIDDREIHEGRFRNGPMLTQLTAVDAIIFGSPTYMGGVAAQFKAFADATSALWSTRALAMKVAAGFTTGTNPRGDLDSCLRELFVLARQHGMVWAGNGADAQGDFTAHADLGFFALNRDGDFTAKALRSARNFGHQVATITQGRALHQLQNKISL